MNNMIFRIFILICSLSLLGCSDYTRTSGVQKVCFSPGYCCRDSILNLISSSKRSIKIAIYAFTDRDISNALLDAHHRGVKITIVTDAVQSSSRTSDIDYLKTKGVEIYKNKTTNAEHNKFAIFDDKYLITGSYNWTSNAKKNSENCVVISDKAALFAFEKRFNQLLIMYY